MRAYEKPYETLTKPRKLLNPNPKLYPKPLNPKLYPKPSSLLLRHSGVGTVLQELLGQKQQISSEEHMV